MERHTEAVDGSAAGAPPPIVELSDAECREILHSQRMCVVSMNDEGVPYAVPVYYGYDGTALYLGVAEGRKTRALDANPQVHIVVTETGSGDRWRSVAIAGRATVLDAPDEREAGIAVLIAHNRRPDRGAAPPPPRRRGGRILRIDDAVITGRARR